MSRRMTLTEMPAGTLLSEDPDTCPIAEPEGDVADPPRAFVDREVVEDGCRQELRRGERVDGQEAGWQPAVETDGALRSAARVRTPSAPPAHCPASVIREVGQDDLDGVHPGGDGEMSGAAERPAAPEHGIAPADESAEDRVKGARCIDRRRAHAAGRTGKVSALGRLRRCDGRVRGERHQKERAQWHASGIPLREGEPDRRGPAADLAHRPRDHPIGPGSGLRGRHCHGWQHGDEADAEIEDVPHFHGGDSSGTLERGKERRQLPGLADPPPPRIPGAVPAPGCRESRLR